MNNTVPDINESSFKQAVLNQTSSNDNSVFGFKDILAGDGTYEVSRTRIPARCTLPLQMEKQTSKHLTVLSGIVHVTLSDDVMVLVADESLYIPQGVLYGLENRADSAALVVSVDYNN